MEQFERNKKTNALLQLALKYHNAKRHNEAAWLYQKIIDTYPKSAETVQHASTNLNNLKNKMESLQLIKPKELQDGDYLLDDNEPINIDSASLSAHTLDPSPKTIEKNKVEIDKTFIKPKQETLKRTKFVDEIFCPSCGEPIKMQAIICVHCGVVFRELLTLHGNGKSKVAAIFLSVCMGYWAWLYTARFDWWKFFVGFLVLIVAFYFRYFFPPYSNFLAIIIPFFVAWLWPIVENSARNSDFFLTYYNRHY